MPADVLVQPSVGPCRWCGRPAFVTDDEGKPAHPCCARWVDRGKTGPDCPHCLASEAMQGRRDRRGRVA